MDFTFLQSDAAQAALAQFGANPVTDNNHLQIAAHLRKQFAGEQAQALLEQITLRQKAAGKFSRAAAMYFERTALEQASGELLSQYRARRYANVTDRIADLGCSIGGDALALAQVRPVLGIDYAFKRLQLAQHNVALYAPGNFEALQADLLTMPIPKVGAIFFDPARRNHQGRRILDPQAYLPPLPMITRWRQSVPAAGVKLAPGISYNAIPQLDEAEMEFIALGYELKEAVAWYGALHSQAKRRATILPAGHTMTEADGDQMVGIRPVGNYLYEPNPAILRARLVTHLGSQIDAGQIDSSIAYLTNNQLRETPFARRFEILDSMPFQLKRLRAYLRERRIGQVTIKKRGSPLDVDSLHKQLRLNGSEAALLFLTQIAGQPSVLIARPI